MPYYVYWCPKCFGVTEERRLIADRDKALTCPNCGAAMQRQFTVPDVHYKCRGVTGACRAGDGRIDPFRHKDGSPLTEADLNRVPPHCEEEG